VQNTFSAYEQIPALNPYNMDDFLKVHNFITENLIQESGQFRTVGVAIVNSKKEVIHSGANFNQVPTLLTELFEWGKNTDTHEKFGNAFYDRAHSPFPRWKRQNWTALANAYSHKVERAFRVASCGNNDLLQPREILRSPIAIATQRRNSGLPTVY
jgi:hypothetical protein